MALPELKGRVSLDGRGVSHTLNKVKGEFSAFASYAKGALGGIFATAAVAAHVRGVRDAVTRVKDLSEQYRITTDEVQKSDYAMEQSGLRFEDLGTALTKLGDARQKAVRGNEELRETFKKYGIELAQLNNPQLRNYDILLMLSDAMSKTTLTSREQADVMDLLGARSAKLLTTLTELSNVKPPSMFSREDIERIDQADKFWKRFLTATKVRTAEILGDAANFYGIGEDSIAEKERKAAMENAKVLSSADIAKANAEKWFRIYWEQENKKAGLFEVDADKKPEKKRPMGTSRQPIDFPSAEGLNAAGAYSSGFIRGFNPQVFVERDQLARLQDIHKELQQINSKTGYTSMMNTGGDWAV